MQPLKQAMVAQADVDGLVARRADDDPHLQADHRTRSLEADGAGGYKLFKTYEICAWSGELGPKVKEGDRQSPEGFYTITPGLMNPNSNYYLAFNTGFPNKFDRAYGRTGSDLMVHGDCSSRGCYSMTDESIAEIYALARETFKGGNASFQLQIFPFRMTPRNLAMHADDPNMSFWKNIKEGYDRFELARPTAQLGRVQQAVRLRGSQRPHARCRRLPARCRLRRPSRRRSRPRWRPMRPPWPRK